MYSISWQNVHLWWDCSWTSTSVCVTMFSASSNGKLGIVAGRTHCLTSPKSGVGGGGGCGAGWCCVFCDAIKIQIFPPSCSVCLRGGESPSWFQGGDKLKLTSSHTDTKSQKEEHSSACVSLQEPGGSPGRESSYSLWVRTGWQATSLCLGLAKEGPLEPNWGFASKGEGRGIGLGADQGCLLKPKACRSSHKGPVSLEDQGLLPKVRCW